MRTEKEIKEALEKQTSDLLNHIIDYDSIGANSVSLRNRKHIINTLRWVLGQIKVIEPSQFVRRKKGAR